MDELLDIIIKNVIGNEDYEIEKTVEENDVNYVVKTKSENLSKLIGRKGVVADSIRTIMRTMKDVDQKIYIKFIEA